MKFFECSARTRQNVDEAFLTLARDVVSRVSAAGGGAAGGGGRAGGGKGTVSIGLAEHSDKKGAGCCVK